MQNYLPQTNTDTFFAMVMHDLKTPIYSGIFALELLLKDGNKNFKPDDYEILKDVLNSVKFVKNMTENILCKYRNENGRLQLNKELCSFEELCKNCIQESKYLLNEKNQTIKFICDNKDTNIYIDILEIRRVINNLISNASEHSPKNSKIIVSINLTKNAINFVIQDFGNGMDKNDISKIFDKDISICRKEKRCSTGLGLYITKSIVEAHGGKISVSSKKDFGTKFNILLPL